MKITVKMERDILKLVMDDERSFQEQKDDIVKHLKSMKSFLVKGNVKFAYEGAELTFDEEIELCNIADGIFETEVKFCHKRRPPHEIMRHVMTNNERIVRKVTRTVEKGEIVESNGDLIIVGDVNPTAQLLAEGDIYVIGNLRGVAHAGYTGDTSSIIYAMGMNPVMVKIGDEIAFNTNASQKNINGLARMENGRIKIRLL